MNKDHNFIFAIGAQKSGTTTLHNLLLSNKRINLPKIKETHFFSHDKVYSKGYDWYLNQFIQSDGISCEVDPSYLFFSQSADRIKATVKAPKFIVIFRKPLDRALSHYLMSCYRGYENLSFLSALEVEGQRLKDDKELFSFINHSYLKRGNYVEQLSVYLNRFDRSNFLFIKFEDLISKENSNVINSICNFMGIENDFNIDEMPESNKKRKVKSKLIRDFLYKDSAVKRMLSSILPSEIIKMKIKHILDSFNSNYYNEIDSKNQFEEIMDQIPEKYFMWSDEQSELLSSLTGLGLNDWKYGK